MTCIAGLVHDGQVWLASDAQETWGYVKNDCGSKIVQHRDLAVAFTGKSAVSEAFQSRFKMPDVPEDKSKHDRWIRVAVPDAIKSCLREAGVLRDDSGLQDWGGAAILGWRGNLYAMDGHSACYPQVRPFTAHGSGSEVAIGSLFSTEGKDPEERLRIAISAANMWSVGCGVNVHIVKAGASPEQVTTC